jgi:hypothetical protein
MIKDPPPHLLGLERGLIIRKPHLGKILAGDKTWEMRTTDTKIRGRIGLIESGSGMIVGEATLTGTRLAPIKPSLRATTRNLHQLEPQDWKKMNHWKWAWILKDATRYETPTPYDHPKGAVIWVTLSKKQLKPNDHERM